MKRLIRILVILMIFLPTVKSLSNDVSYEEMRTMYNELVEEHNQLIDQERHCADLLEGSNNLLKEQKKINEEMKEQYKDVEKLVKKEKFKSFLKGNGTGSAGTIVVIAIIIILSPLGL